MKSASAIGLVVVIFALLIVGWALFAPSESTTVLAPTPVVSPTPVDATLGQVTEVSATPIVSGSPSASPSAQRSATVEITDTGFVPATLTVKAGTTVKFLNNGQGTHWPASNPHPTHGDLAGFDAKGALATGDSYSFTFDKVGTWGYHDHLHPNLKGTIVVQ